MQCVHVQSHLVRREEHRAGRQRRGGRTRRPQRGRAVRGRFVTVPVVIVLFVVVVIVIVIVLLLLLLLVLMLVVMVMVVDGGCADDSARGGVGRASGGQFRIGCGALCVRTGRGRRGGPGRGSERPIEHSQIRRSSQQTAALAIGGECGGLARRRTLTFAATHQPSLLWLAGQWPHSRVWVACAEGETTCGKKRGMLGALLHGVLVHRDGAKVPGHPRGHQTPTERAGPRVLN